MSDLMADRRGVDAAAEPAEPARGPSTWTGIRVVAAGQVARVKVARIPLLAVATVQSVGIVVLLRGAFGHLRGPAHEADAAAIVAGAAVLVAGFVGLNLLAQRFGALKASRALDYYAALPVPPVAVVLGTAAAYAGFALPGAIVTAVVGCAIFGLPLAGCWLVIPAVVIAGLSLAGVGATFGMVLSRPELATVAGQLGMTAVLFLGVIPPGHLPIVVRGLRLAVPGMLAVDSLADALRPHVEWLDLLVRLAVALGYAVVALAVASRSWRRAIGAGG